MAMPTVPQAAETAKLSLIAAPTVSVITASVRHVVMTTIVTGSLVPREEVQVGVDLNGYRIIEIRTDEGVMVKAGQILARLSTDILEVQLVQNRYQRSHDDFRAWWPVLRA
jgi:multidrug efflux pump subunit AcrA (membrane-fusion protein)